MLEQHIYDKKVIIKIKCYLEQKFRNFIGAFAGGTDVRSGPLLKQDWKFWRLGWPVQSARSTTAHAGLDFNGGAVLNNVISSENSIQVILKTYNNKTL